MRREIVREHGVMISMGNMRRAEILAVFLFNGVGRLQAVGLSSSHLVLRRSLAAIGSYRGLSLETMSRTRSRFLEEGLLEISGRHIHIHSAQALGDMLTSHHGH